MLPAGAMIAGWVSHPLGNAALSRRTHKPDVKAGKELVQLATEIWHDLPEEKSTNSRRHRRYWAGSWEPARSRFPSGLDDVENFFHSAVALAFSPPIPVPAPPALLLILTGILDLIGSNKRRNAA